MGSQETPGVTGKFGLGIWNEVGQRLMEFCQENALVIVNTFFHPGSKGQANGLCRHLPRGRGKEQNTLLDRLLTFFSLDSAKGS